MDAGCSKILAGIIGSSEYKPAEPLSCSANCSTRLASRDFQANSEPLNLIAISAAKLNEEE